MLRTTHADHRSRFLQLRIRHLTRKRALPNQVIEFTFLRSSFDVFSRHIRRTNCFMRFLSPFRLGVIIATLMIVRSHALCNHGFSRVKTECRKIHRVGTHIGNQSRLVERLRKTHGGSHGKSKLSSRLLLQR